MQREFAHIAMRMPRPQAHVANDPPQIKAFVTRLLHEPRFHSVKTKATLDQRPQRTLQARIGKKHSSITPAGSPASSD